VNAFRYQLRGSDGGSFSIALIALAAGIGPCLPGLAASAKLAEVPAFWTDLYAYAWFVSFGVSFVSYLVLMKIFGRLSYEPEA